MISKISGLIEEVDSYQPASAQELEDFRIKFLSKKGILNQLFEDFKQLDNASKRNRKMDKYP
jgi:phenylalanyl-tRNA synthetase alpha chain